MPFLIRRMMTATPRHPRRGCACEYTRKGSFSLLPPVRLVLCQTFPFILLPRRRDKIIVAGSRDRAARDCSPLWQTNL